ncbi:hypothetical protein [Motilimonas sp. E26]|uniref:hypothetical protein n=1 Tax=Motilimonas sp. E26 TaxID=2865674 RepID=UPI001E41DFC4|nr:hypothetical protein [Motilimonas sp. E26]MCE0555437.1 hypothetical protein [Motilimonas sp. E26]
MNKLLPCILVLSLVGCASTSNQLTFKPKLGEKVANRVFIDTEIEVNDQNISQYSDLLINYHVTAVTERTDIDVKIDYLNMNMGSQQFSSTNPYHSLNPLPKLMEQGFRFELETSTGELLNFHAYNQDVWQKLSQDNDVIEQLKQFISQPNFYQAIPLQPNKKVLIKNFHGNKSATLTVEKVLESTLIVRIESEQLDEKIYAKAVINKTSGWVERMVLIGELPFEKNDYKGTVRTSMIIVPGDTQLPQMLTDFSFPSFPMPYDFVNHFTPEMEDWLTASKQDYPKKEKIIGVFNTQRDTVSLYLPTQLERDIPDTFHLENISASDLKGPIKQDFIKIASERLVPSDGYIRVAKEVSPLGWDNSAEKLASITSLSAQIVVPTTTVQPIQIPLAAGSRSSYRVHDLELSVVSSDDGKMVTITPSSSNHVWLTHIIKGAEGAKVEISPVGNLPDWLESDQLRKLSFAESNIINNEKRLTFSQAPEAITLFAIIYDENNPSRQDITFISPSEYLLNPQLPPFESLNLFKEEGSIMQTENPSIKRSEIKPVGIENQRLSLTMMFDQEQACTIKVVKSPKINKQKLVWKKHEDPDNFQNKLSKYSTWQLTTADNEQQYFYGKTVVSQLNCRYTPQWQSVDVLNKDMPWLIKLDQLAPGISLKTPLKQFLAQYRFINAEGHALQLATNSLDSKVDIETATLASFVFPEKQLKLKGHAVKVQRMIKVKKPYQKTFTSQFAQLPQGE